MLTYSTGEIMTWSSYKGQPLEIYLRTIPLLLPTPHFLSSLRILQPKGDMTQLAFPAAVLPFILTEVQDEIGVLIRALARPECAISTTGMCSQK